MNVFEWMALIGAAAWLPQIGVAAYRFFVKPVLHIVAVPEGELTYNSLGPIVNLRAALVAQRKDAVIVDMRMALRHEKGRVIHLVWDSFVEHFSEMKTQDGERGEFTRDQAATALKVNTALPVEKFFRFRDPDFKAEYRDRTAAANDELSRIAKEDPTAVAGFLKSKAYTDLMTFYNNGFYWEPGRYDVTLSLTVLGLSQPRSGRTQFVLSDDDVDRIRKNLPLIEQRMREIAEGVPADQQAFPGHWATPSFEATTIQLGRT
jgi:hypothetical protein